LPGFSPWTESVDIVWENTPSEAFRPLVDRAAVYNHLSNSSVFEDKAELALVLRRSAEPQLESRVFATPELFAEWCRATCDSWGRRLWVAKDPTGNSGVGIWMLGAGNWQEVAARASERASKAAKRPRIAVVVQEYVADPLLWCGRKLQFRLYCVVTGTLDVWVYRHGFLQVCNKRFRPASGTGGFDDEVHITNVSRNMHNAALFQSERPCDVATRYPRVFASAARALEDLVTRCAAPFLRWQRRASHFELMGVDFIADARDGRARLIECNCPPNVAGSSERGTVEDFHQRTFDDLVRAFAVVPLEKGRPPAHEPAAFEAAAPEADRPEDPAGVEARKAARSAGARASDGPAAGERESGLWHLVGRLDGPRRAEHRADASEAAEECGAMLARNRLAFALYRSKALKEEARTVAREIAQRGLARRRPRFGRSEADVPAQ
jgi:hypothetical protein